MLGHRDPSARRPEVPVAGTYVPGGPTPAVGRDRPRRMDPCPQQGGCAERPNGLGHTAVRPRRDLARARMVGARTPDTGHRTREDDVDRVAQWTITIDIDEH